MAQPETKPSPCSHAVPRDGLKRWVPFGIGQTKPKHFRDMASVIWNNRDNLGYAWKVLSRGVCDGCALGVAGFKDWTVKGPHLCMTRLNLLRLNTMPEMDVSEFENPERLESMDNAELRKLGRIPYPMLREGSDRGFRRISWEEALDRISNKIRATDPKRLAFFVTARGLTNEVYYMAQKAARFIGTNNIDNAARICHAPSTAAMKRTLGVAASTCSYKDWYGTDLIVFFGSNPANDQPVTTKFIHEAKKLGTKVIMVNPYLEPGMKRYWVPSNLDSAVFGTDIADEWYPVSQGGDIAFLYGTIKVLLANDWIDHAFIGKNVEGFADLRQKVEDLDFATLELQSGLSQQSMEQFAQALHAARNGVLIWSMGITQSTFGADAVQMILNLGLIKGWLGRDKCGLVPIRGHSSVQGGAEMGCYATALPGGKPLTIDNLDALEAAYGFPLPRDPGLTTVEMVEAAARGQLDLMYCVGGNFLRNLPEPDYVRKAMANVPLRVHQDIILTDQMFIPSEEAVILLPAKTRYEQDDGGTETSTERRIMFSPEIPRQVGEAQAEWKILRSIALQVRPDKAEQFGCETGQTMREEIARVVPFYDGIQHFKTTGDAVQYGGPHLCVDGICPTPDGKAHLHSVALPELRPLTEQFRVSTRRGKQFNSLIYAEVDPLTGAPRDAVFMNAEDAGKLHLMQGDRVQLSNDTGRMQGRVFLAPIAPGNLQVHWPEGNVLIPKGLVDSHSGVPDYNAYVQVERS